jgi:hypothetical protein
MTRFFESDAALRGDLTSDKISARLLPSLEEMRSFFSMKKDSSQEKSRIIGCPTTCENGKTYLVGHVQNTDDELLPKTVQTAQTVLPLIELYQLPPEQQSQALKAGAGTFTHGLQTQLDEMKQGILVGDNKGVMNLVDTGKAVLNVLSIIPDAIQIEVESLYSPARADLHADELGVKLRSIGTGAQAAVMAGQEVLAATDRYLDQTLTHKIHPAAPLSNAIEAWNHQSTFQKTEQATELLVSMITPGAAGEVLKGTEFAAHMAKMQKFLSTANRLSAAERDLLFQQLISESNNLRPEFAAAGDAASTVRSERDGVLFAKAVPEEKNLGTTHPKATDSAQSKFQTRQTTKFGDGPDDHKVPTSSFDEQPENQTVKKQSKGTDKSRPELIEAAEQAIAEMVEVRGPVAKWRLQAVKATLGHLPKEDVIAVHQKDYKVLVTNKLVDAKDRFPESMREGNELKKFLQAHKKSTRAITIPETKTIVLFKRQEWSATVNTTRHEFAHALADIYGWEQDKKLEKAYFRNAEKLEKRYKELGKQVATYQKESIRVEEKDYKEFEELHSIKNWITDDKKDGFFETIADLYAIAHGGSQSHQIDKILESRFSRLMKDMEQQNWFRARSNH